MHKLCSGVELFQNHGWLIRDLLCVFSLCVVILVENWDHVVEMRVFFFNEDFVLDEGRFLGTVCVTLTL